MKNEGWRKYLCESLQPKSLFSVKEALVVATVTPSGIHSPGSSRVFSEGTGRHLIRETGNHTSAHAPRLWSRGQHCAVLFDRDEQHGRSGSGKKKTLWYGRRCKHSKGNFQLNFSSDCYCNNWVGSVYLSDRKTPKWKFVLRSCLQLIRLQ